MKNAYDLIIMLSLFSSYAWMTSRKLISSERDLKSAIQTFKKAPQINPEDRFDIPVIPRPILKQRIIFQRGLLLIAYGKQMKAALIFTRLFKIGKVFDPVTRYESLKQLKEIFSKMQKHIQIDLHPQLKHIEMLTQLFNDERYKKSNTFSIELRNTFSL